MALQPEMEKHLSTINDFRTVFKESPQGQRILDHLKDRFHWNDSSLTVDLVGQPMAVVDKDTVIANEGQRSVVCYIQGLVDADVSSLRQTMEEGVKAVKKQQDNMDDLGV